MTQLSSQADRNDASFLMTDAYSGGGAHIEVQQEAWRQFLGKNIQIESKAVPRNYWNLDEYSSGEGVLTLDGHVFRLVPGLWGEGTVSFESVSGGSGMFVCQRNGRIFVTTGDLNDEGFRRDCSFFVHEDKFFPGYVSFASPDDRWIRQDAKRLRLSQ